MKNNTFYKKTLISFVMILFSFATKGQTTNENPIKYYEDCIINKTIPEEQYYYDYNLLGGQRMIIWNDKLICNYKYSNEAFDKIGYDYVKTSVGDKNHYTKTYRNCNKGIIIEVTEWYRIKLSISMQWYPIDLRKGVPYLMFCK